MAQVKGAMIPDYLQIWQMGCHDLSKVRYGTFGFVDKEQKVLFRKNLRWLLKKIK